MLRYDRSRPVVFVVFKDEVSCSVHEGGLCHHAASSLRFGVFSFSFPSAVSMEIRICLVGEAQRPAECVSTVNIDHNTIYWVRCNGQLTPGGSITMETSSKHTLFLASTQLLVLHTNAYGSLWSVLKVPTRICALVHRKLLYSQRNYKNIS